MKPKLMLPLLALLTLNIVNCNRTIPFTRFTAAEEIIDFDRDGIALADDNCPQTYNPEQIDILPPSEDEFSEPGDGVGDACQSFGTDDEPTVDTSNNLAPEINLVTKANAACTLDVDISDRSEDEVELRLHAVYEQFYLDPQASGDSDMAETSYLIQADENQNSVGNRLFKLNVYGDVKRKENAVVRFLELTAVAQFSNGLILQSETFYAGDPCSPDSDDRDLNQNN